MSIWAVFAAALPVAWLLPNHYPPWSSAWQDGFTLALSGLALVFINRTSSLPRSWIAVLVIASTSVLLQWASGRIYFGGDALVALMYFGALAIGMLLGNALAGGPSGRHANGLELLATTTTASAVACVGIALVQWTGALSLGIWGADLPPGARPYANFAQANHFNTALFLGLCSLALLRESGRIGHLGFWAGAVFMLLGMVMSGSRTGWLQAAVAITLVTALQKQTRLRVRLPSVAALVLAYAGMTASWPWLNETLLLSAGRGVIQQLDGGVRLPLWRSLFSAVQREPLWGYGWQQVSAAQLAVAAEQPSINRHFEHSHNIFLDLTIWAGLPVGIFLAALAVYALTQQVRALRDARALWLMVAAGGVFAHAMVEFPLEYAYFLVPTGIALGAAHSLSPYGAPIGFSRWALQASGTAFLALLMAVTADYFAAEQSQRLLRLESAHIGTSRVESQAPELRLLTQLGTWLVFTRTEAKPGMSPVEVEWMRQVSTRFAYPPAMFRYALAAGLNGNPGEAKLTLTRLCRIHPPARCEEGRQGWKALQERFPVLLSIPPP